MKPKLVLCDGWKGVHAYVHGVLKGEASRGTLAARDVIVLVPTMGAGHLFRTGLEQTLLEKATVAALPEISTMRMLLQELVERSLGKVRAADNLLREALLEKSLDEAARAGAEPPFDLRSSLAPRVLAFYDRLYLQGHRIEAFGERVLEEFDVPGDVGAERMAALTRFLIEGLRRYRDKLSGLSLEDETTLRRALLERGPVFPYRRLIAIGAETTGPADLVFLSSAKGLDSLEIVMPKSLSATSIVRSLENTVFLEKAHLNHFASRPSLLSPSPASSTWLARDREDVLTEAARLLKAIDSDLGLPPLERIAIVVPSRLPYLYLAKKVLSQTGIPHQLQDDFPLATEPYIAAMDLILELVGLDARRSVALGLLQNPFFRFPGVEPDDVAGLERELAKRREPGCTKTWKKMLARWRRRPVQKALPGMEDREGATPGIAALKALVRCTSELSPLALTTSSLTEKVGVLHDFLSTFGRPLAALEGSERHERARGGFMSILERLAEAARHVGDPPITFQEFREKLHRAIESHTFSLRTGDGGIQIVDSRSAGFGSFDLVLAAGLNEGEWPSRAERNIFYPQWILKDFGWPTDAQTLALERAYFVDLLRLPTESIGIFRHLLEDEVPTVPSPFLEEVDRVAEGGRRETPEKMTTLLISRAEALRDGVIPIEEHFREAWRPGRITQTVFDPEPISATAFELYLRCPFKHFARYVVGIEEEDDLEESFTPMERGRVLHDILQTGFDRWDARETGPRPITAESYDEVLALFKKVAMEKLPVEGRRIEMAKLFGGPGEPGAIEWLLRLEMKRGPLRRRLLEYAFGSTYHLDKGEDGESPWHLHIKGRADRVDIDPQGHLHLFDYKSGRAPESKLTIQVPLYALCLSQQLSAKTAEAAYLSLRDKKIVPRQDYAQALDRLRDTFERISKGSFTPQPYQDHLCRACGYAGVCRKEIVETKAMDQNEAT